MPERSLAAHALAVDIRAVQTAEIAQDELAFAQLNEAMVLRDNLVEQLNRVVRMAPEAVDRPEFNRLLSFSGSEDQPGHG